MKNRWRARDAKAFLKLYRPYGEELALRTYTARLIGQDHTLVLHGGGNTSVKTTVRAVTQEPVPVVCVKGSGWDLATIEPAGHPALSLDSLNRLRSLNALSDEEMVNQFRIHLLDSRAPNPSVETLLHAFLPHRYIDHTHADAVLALLDQPEAEKRVEDWAQNRLATVPYIMPGFALAKLAASIFEKDRQVEGLVLLKHGIFTFGDSAEESYERMIRWVDRAERQLAKKRPVAWRSQWKGRSPIRQELARTANIIRGQVAMSRSSGRQDDPLMRMIVRHRSSPAILRFVNSKEGAALSQIGPATPDHVIRTKPKPLVLPPMPFKNESAFRVTLRARLEKFKRAYQSYFSSQCKANRVQKKPLDPLPRVVLVPGAGLFAAGEDAKAADVALDIYETTMGIIERASRFGRYESLATGDLFEVEYWSLEQAKLGKIEEKRFSRKVVWISGAASGIGRATAKAFASLGAHVFLTDRDEKLLKETINALGLKSRGAMAVCDVTNEREVEGAFEACSLSFGGVDIVISNAGAAPIGDMAQCPDELLRKSFELNFFAHQNVARVAIGVFKRQGFGGNLLFNASKSTFNPGPGLGPYTIPKAGVIALMKQYAVELGSDHIRCNAVNADRVRTALYAEGLLEKRAKARGLTVKQYVSGNLLGEEVYPEDVAYAFVSLAQARKTTGAVLPVDGGNAAAFPR